MSLERKEIDPSQETDESRVKSQIIILKKGFIKMTVCLVFLDVSFSLLASFFYGEKIMKVERFL